MQLEVPTQLYYLRPLKAIRKFNVRLNDFADTMLWQVLQGSSMQFAYNPNPETEWSSAPLVKEVQDM
jgi:hypothetical protein